MLFVRDSFRFRNTHVLVCLLIKYLYLIERIIFLDVFLTGVWFKILNLFSC